MANIGKQSYKLDQPPCSLTYEQADDLFQTYDIVREILDSSQKAALWMVTNNSLLGNNAPLDLILLGRGHKVLKFVKNAQSENKGWDEDESN